MLQRPQPKETTGRRIIKALSAPEVGADGLKVNQLVDIIYTAYPEYAAKEAQRLAQAEAAEEEEEEDEDEDGSPKQKQQNKRTVKRRLRQQVMQWCHSRSGRQQVKQCIPGSNIFAMI